MVNRPDSPANEPVTRRFAIAERAASAYIANPHVAAVLVAGSVARGLADTFSDIELDVYWSSPPTDDERVSAVEGAASWHPASTRMSVAFVRAQDVVDDALGEGLVDGAG